MRREDIIRAFAGTIVLLSLSLGWFAHPGWFALTAFVGFNLLQSSFTHFCPLEMILAKFQLGQSERPDLNGRA